MNMHLMLLSANFVYLRRSFGVARLICVLAILMAVLPAAPVNAGLNQWTSNRPASSGPILSLAVDPSAPEGSIPVNLFICQTDPGIEFASRLPPVA